MHYMFKSALFVTLSLSLVACGGESASPTEDTTKMDAAPKETVKAEAIPDNATLDIAGGDDMKFDKDKLSVYEGQEVTLTLSHSGTMTKEAMGHNWVLLKSGVSMSDFAQAGMDNPDTDYIDPDNASDVIASTKVVGGGESTTVTFTAPSVGSYMYLCSFPGHYSMMKGVLKVKKRP